MVQVKKYSPKHPVRILTAASLFDGHDASINIMRRIIQATGVEVIHIGHNHSVEDIVTSAIQEDVQAIALTSYQGGHMEFFRYMHDMLQARGCGHIKIFGGGGGTILPAEIKALHSYGITHVYSPDDSRTMGLQGMINHMVRQCDFALSHRLNGELSDFRKQNPAAIARLISAAENKAIQAQRKPIQEWAAKSPSVVVGITGTGGAGKSSLIDELIHRFLVEFKTKSLAVLSADPSRVKTGGALLGDRIRMNAIYTDRVYMRSMATRQHHASLSEHIDTALHILKAARFDLIILESAGIGQADTSMTAHADLLLYVMTPEYGAATQLEKINMLDYADLIAINKFDTRHALDALREVKKQYRRAHLLFDADDKDLPVYGTMASQFNDTGLDALYAHLMQLVHRKKEKAWPSIQKAKTSTAPTKNAIIPQDRIRYLSEIAATIRHYNKDAQDQKETAQTLYALHKSLKALKTQKTPPATLKALQQCYKDTETQVHETNHALIKAWPEKVERYAQDLLKYHVRDQELSVENYTRSLSHTRIPKVSLPRYEAWGDVLHWLLQENVPGEFPFTAGVFPLKRIQENPTRMFAGEGSPERTNKRFHYLCKDTPFARLSTAFDSVTLYGEDPAARPDIYGKVGNSGVSVCTLDDAKKLYSGFDLCDPSVSVSMTINGPAAAVCAFFMNAAIDQQCEKYIRKEGLLEEVQKKIKQRFADKEQTPPQYTGAIPQQNKGLGLLLLGTTGEDVLPKDRYERIKKDALSQVRGTVQADILKEDQAQNTCIFSTDFSLRLMGDMQAYFIDHMVRNFYSVSISGYHIAEAGANPITQLAFTLANGFTYVEYYRSRGMPIDKFAPNLSFFFSNGVDPEYAVIGRVARRLWAKAMKHGYGANERSQRLKYHIQTSGRSLHAQEISFNDIRTTLQALYAIYDNCNSLHTNAYDEAITTPTEESVRRALAIQLIIQQELGLAKNENPMQGSFIIEELTDLVEEAVLMEFDRLTDRGGVLGAMEAMYQRNKIQEESLYYETRKANGAYPVVGVNTFLAPKGASVVAPKEIIRATEAEKKAQILQLAAFQGMHKEQAAQHVRKLQDAALWNKNTFNALLEATKSCSLGQVTQALYKIGGQYRRNM